MKEKLSNRRILQIVSASVVCGLFVIGAILGVVLGICLSPNGDDILPEQKDNPFIFDVAEENCVQLSSTASTVADDGTVSQTLTASITPSSAPQYFVWSISFANPNSAWANGKTVTDYVTLSNVDNSGTATVTCLQGFSEQIIVKVMAVADNACSASATIDYAKKRFRRKAYLNKWNYFVTITYDDKKHDEESFRKKLRRCLSNLHTRRGWKYMGVFEHAPETRRLHFHALMYIPDGEMIGNVAELRDYSTAQGQMQITHSNTFFADSFGRNDFEQLNEQELRHGGTINYLLKYISKTGERIVYSRGIPTAICMKVKDKDIATSMEDYVTKYLLFDDVIKYERDIARYKTKQMTFIDIFCNPPKVA